MVRFLTAFIGLLVTAMLTTYAWLGGLSPVVVTETTFAEREIVFATHWGAYSKIGDSWRAFQTEWELAGLDRCDALAVYLDPPGTSVPAQRSVVACDISAQSPDAKDRLRSALPHTTLPTMRTLTVTFPYRHVASFFVAPMVAYPAITRRLNAEGAKASSALEIYGPMDTMKTIAVMAVVDAPPGAYTELAAAFDPVAVR